MMTKDWRQCPLGQVAEVQTGPFGSQLHASEYTASGIPAIMPTNIGARLEIKTTDIARISNYDAERLSKYLVAENDIVYSRRGDVEKCAFISKIEHGWLCGTGCLRVRFTSKDIFPKFCAYYLSTEEIKGWVSSNAVGTTMPNLNTKILSRLPILLPPLPEQKAIAAVLSSLDDKIDLLHRQNKTLEAMAETLFRQWFVEEADDSWEEKKLGDFFPVRTGKKNANYSSTDGLYPFFTCSQDTLRAPGFSFEGKAILLAGNGDFNVKRYSGKFEVYQRTYVLIPNEDIWYDWLYVYIKYYLAEITGDHRGSVINFITKGMIEDRAVLIPRENIAHKLAEFSNIYEKVDANHMQIRTLSNLRDTLLPKLMSGEVRVAL